MADTMPVPTAQAVSRQAGTHPQRWGVVSAVILLALIFALAAAWFLRPHQTGHEGRTVGDAAALVTGPETAGPETDEDGQRPGYRLVELAEALGIPEAAMPKQAFEAGDSRKQSREELEAVMDTAVREGRLSRDEAAGVLKAFDEGLIEGQSGSLIASNGEK